MAKQPVLWTVEEYADEKGRKPILEFLSGLQERNKSEAIALISILRERGNQLRPPQSKLVEKGLFELRGHQVRIFYMFRPGGRVVLLDGIIKKHDKIPVETLKRVRSMQQSVEAVVAKTG